MRILHAAALATAALVLAAAASAQGLGEAAAKEKERLKALPGKTKTITESDLGQPMGPGTLSSPGGAVEESPPAEEPAGEGATAETGAEGAATAPEGQPAEGAPAAEQAAAEQRAAAEAAWRKKLDIARKEEQAYRDIIDRLQFELNDMSGGIYNPGRASRIAFLEENKQKLAEVQQRIAALEAEGRTNDYR
jgi:hypothetical protein